MPLRPEISSRSFLTLVDMNKELRVGVIVRTHGIRGEVKVFPTTDSPDRFDELKNVIIRRENRFHAAEVEKVRYFKNLVIVKFKDIDSIDEVEKYVGADLCIKREDGVPLSEGEYYIADIIGMEVYDEDGIHLGTVKDVMETGANDVYLVSAENGKEYMLPAVKECIRNIDIENNEMKVHVIPGLLDL